MLPLIWRSLGGTYLKVFALTLVSFIALLLVSRLEDIAEFATFGTPLRLIGLFTLLQIPFVLPLAIPIACVIAGWIVGARLSQSHELTALRAAGLTFRDILTPLLLLGGVLSLGNFAITSEVATTAHLATRKMVYELTATNPLLLLQNGKIAQLRGAYVQMDPVKNGRAARDVLVGFVQPGGGRIALLMADGLEVGRGKLKGEGVTVLTTAEERVFLEHHASSEGMAPDLAHLLRKKGWKVAADHLSLPLLKARMKSVEGRKRAKCITELVRRGALGMAPLTFTLLGVGFAVQIGRSPSRGSVVWVLLLAAGALIAFFAAKELDHLVWAAALLYLLPHLLISSLVIYRLYRKNQGWA